MSSVSWLLSTTFDSSKLLLLVLCAIIMHTLARHLVWRLFVIGTARKWVSRLAYSWLGWSVTQIISLLYSVGLPAVAVWRADLLVQVGISPTWVQGTGSMLRYLFGIAKLTNMLDLGIAGIMLLLGVGFLTALWLWYVRQDSHDCQTLTVSVTWGSALMIGLESQMMWMLYRSVRWGIESDIYIVFSSLALIALTWWLDPYRRHAFNSPESSSRMVRDVLIALFTMCASALVHSLWLLVLMHVIWLWLSDRILSSFVLKYAGIGSRISA